MNTHRIALITIGLVVPTLGYLGIHELVPGGHPEDMNDVELANWAASDAHAIWAGGSLQLVAACLLMVWGVLLRMTLERDGRSPSSGRIALASAQVTAAVLGVAGLLQVTAGVLATPEEAYRSESFLPVTAILAPNLNVAAWCFLAPAALAVAASRARFWLRVFTGALGLGLVLTFALPFVAWFLAFPFLVVTSLGIGVPGARSGFAVSHR